MSQNGFRDSAGNFDPSSMESLQLAQAIANAHQKLLVAEKRDAVMQIENVEGTYRHRKLALKDLGHGPQRHATIMLVPPADRVASARVTRLVLEIPTIPWEDAGEMLQGIYKANLEENAVNLFGENATADFSRPRYVPTRDVFGEATNSAGETIKFLLSPTGLHAYEQTEDIIQTEPHVVAGGQQYIVETSLTTYEAQAAMVTEWFESTGALSDLIQLYEPMTFDGNTGTSAA